MTRHNTRVVIVDAFAGPGRYTGGEPGSPLILLDSYLSHSYRAHMTSEIVYLFIEERGDRVAHLENELRSVSVPNNVRIRVEHGRYESVFRHRLAEIRQSGSQLAPTFAFVDPFGYSDAPMDLTGTFLQFQRCEVLVYMPLPHVARFVGRDGQESAMTSLFGSDAWKTAVRLSGAERRTFLHDLFRDQLVTHGSRYVRSFEIHAGSSHGYHLFFGTNNPLGLEKMKEAMWSLDRLTGQRFSDSTNGAQLVLFQPEVETEPLLAALRARFGTDVFTIDRAEEFTLVETAYMPTHLRTRTLVPAEKQGKIAVVGGRTRAGSFPSGTTLRFLH
jgi:three-Cys-motif partner protein